MERVKGIEPSYEAWEAAVLPLNYTRVPDEYKGCPVAINPKNLAWLVANGIAVGSSTPPQWLFTQLSTFSPA
jgi:hypothetical protein